MDIIDLRDSRDEQLLQQVYHDLYLVCFTDPDEQEDLEQYRQRLFDPQLPPPQPVTHFLVAGENLADPAARVIHGLLIFELYRDSACGLLTYLAITPHSRGKGLARTLVTHAIEVLQSECAKSGRLNAVLGEVHDPFQVDEKFDAISPRGRIKVMKRLGARLVSIRYVQPELRPGDQRSRKLLMLAFPLEGDHVPAVDGQVLLMFLDEFYRALGVSDPKGDSDFQRMRDDIAHAMAGDFPAKLKELSDTLDLPVVNLTSSEELCWIRVDAAEDDGWNPQPHPDSPKRMGFPQIPVVGVALHFVLGRYWSDHPPKLSRASADEFRSFEEDLISYAFLDRGWCQSRAIKLAETTFELPITLRLPNPIRYTAEGQRKELWIGGGQDSGAASRDRPVLLRASFTQFISGLVVLHLVLNNRPQESSVLNEHDIVALAQLWQQRKTIKPEQVIGDTFRPSDLPQEIRFRVPSEVGERDCNLPELLAHVESRLQIAQEAAIADTVATAAHSPDILPHAGTIHVLVAEKSDTENSDHRYGLPIHAELFPVLHRFRQQTEDRTTVFGDKRLERECVALEGLLCGLLDHWDIATDELEDVFARPAICEGRTFNDIHKGTLLSFCDDRRFVDNPAYRRLGMSAYLLLPQSVLLYNESLLQAATKASSFEANDAAEDDYRDAELLMRAALQKDWIPNLFHYPTERRLYADGEISRGLATWRESLLDRLQEINGILEKKRADTDKFINWTIGFIGFTLAIAQVASGWESLAKAILTLTSDTKIDEPSATKTVIAAMGYISYLIVVALIAVYFVLFR